MTREMDGCAPLWLRTRSPARREVIRTRSALEEVPSAKQLVNASPAVTVGSAMRQAYEVSRAKHGSSLKHSNSSLRLVILPHTDALGLMQKNCSSRQTLVSTALVVDPRPPLQSVSPSA
eukprot:6185906-Pleurochrysis_carterae.AAC.1